MLNTFSHSADHYGGDLSRTTYVALFYHFELLLHPALVLWPQLLLQHWMGLVNILEFLLVRSELAGLQDDDEKGEASKSSYGKHHPLLGTKLNHCSFSAGRNSNP